MRLKSKKHAIAILLFSLCVVSGFLLLTEARDETSDLHSVHQLDSLINLSLRQFNISAHQIERKTIFVDSLGARLDYQLRVPSAFSKTLFHASLADVFHPYGIRTPSTVDIVEHSMKLHFLRAETIVARMQLSNDTSLSLNHYRASIAFYSDEPVSSNLLREMQRFGEPFALIYQVEALKEAERLFDRHRQGLLKNQVPYWWIRNRDFGTLYFEMTGKLHTMAPNARLVLFVDADDGGNRRLWNELQRQDWNVVLAGKAQRLSEEESMENMSNLFRRFNTLAREGGQPLMLIPLNQRTLAHLETLLPDYKRNGLVLQWPQNVTF